MIKYFMVSVLFVSSSIFAAPDSLFEPEGEQIKKMWDKNTGAKKFLDLIDAQQHIGQEEEIEKLVIRYYYPSFYKKQELNIEKKLPRLKCMLKKTEEKKELIEFFKKRIETAPTCLFLKDMCDLVTPINFSDKSVLKMPDKTSLERIVRDLMPEKFFEKSELVARLGKLKTVRGIEMAVGLALSTFKKNLMSERNISAEKIDFDPDLKGARIMRNQLIFTIMDSSRDSSETQPL